MAALATTAGYIKDKMYSTKPVHRRHLEYIDAAAVSDMAKWSYLWRCLVHFLLENISSSKNSLDHWFECMATFNMADELTSLRTGHAVQQVSAAQIKWKKEKKNDLHFSCPKRLWLPCFFGGFFKERWLFSCWHKCDMSLLTCQQWLCQRLSKCAIKLNFNWHQHLCWDLYLVSDQLLKIRGVHSISADRRSVSPWLTDTHFADSWPMTGNLKKNDGQLVWLGLKKAVYGVPVATGAL